MIELCGVSGSLSGRASSRTFFFAFSPFLFMRLGEVGKAVLERKLLSQVE
jgi:hypothetical protein